MLSNFDLSPIEQSLVNRYSQKRLPINTSFELTPYCNMSCKMCYVQNNAPGLPILRKEEWLRIGKEAYDLGVLFVLLTGGEPLLHPDFKNIYLALKQMGMVLTLNTNGTLIDQEMADFFAANMPRRINLSLYGPSDEVYSQLCGNPNGFTQTKKAIELLLERNVPVKINIIANTIGFPYLDEMYEFCAKYNLDVEANSYLFEPIRKGNGEKQLYRLSPEKMAEANIKWDKYRFPEEQMMVRSVIAYEALKHYQTPESCPPQCLQCRAGTSSCWICWDGTMTSCVNLPFPRTPVLENGFQKSWEYIVQEVSKIQISGKCQNCSLNTLCNKCAAYAYHENGAFGDVPEVVCQTTLKQAELLASTVESYTPT